MKYRCKHLTIAAWAYPKLQNKKNVCIRCIGTKHVSITARDMYKYKIAKVVCLRCIDSNI